MKHIRNPLVLVFSLVAVSVFTVQPVAAQPDHYKCYKSRRFVPPFTPVDVTLVDQFESTTTTVKRPSTFCNPVAKDNGGPDMGVIYDPTAHLNCYKTKRTKGTPKFQKQIVNIENQFGPQTLQLKKPTGLCVPAEKDLVPSTLDVNHFKCYRAKAVAKLPQQVVTLEDQFTTQETTVKKAYSFCNPVDKNGEGIPDPTNHLTCYKIRRVPGEAKFPGRQVVVEDQFGGGAVSATLGHDGLLCVPTIKEGAPTPTPSPTPTPTPTPTPDPTPDPTPTAPYGSTSRAFIKSAPTLLR